MPVPTPTVRELLALIPARFGVPAGQAPYLEAFDRVERAAAEVVAACEALLALDRDAFPVESLATRKRCGVRWENVVDEVEGWCFMLKHFHQGVDSVRPAGLFLGKLFAERGGRDLEPSWVDRLYDENTDTDDEEADDEPAAVVATASAAAS